MKNIQIVWRNHGIYNVEKLWKITKKIKTNRISIDKIEHNLNKDLWTIKIKTFTLLNY